MSMFTRKKRGALVCSRTTNFGLKVLLILSLALNGTVLFTTLHHDLGDGRTKDWRNPTDFWKTVITVVDDINATASHQSFQSDNAEPLLTDDASGIENDRPHFLEQLMYKYGSDKSKDDHSYTDMYQMLFDPIRLNVKNITEVGVSAGQSLQAWYKYFPNAQIYGFDIETPSSVTEIVEKLKDRVHYKEINLLEKPTNTSLMDKAGLMDESMDIIWEDAMHAPLQQQSFLRTLFRLVKPGGYYIIEDIAYTNTRSRHWHENIDGLASEVQVILKENDAVFVDTHIGHRDWDLWKSRTPTNAIDHVVHNSYLMVIRKRVNPLPPIQMNLRSVAMKPNKVLLSDNDDDDDNKKMES